MQIHKIRSVTMTKVGVNLPKGTNRSGSHEDRWVMGRYNKHTTYTIMQHGTVYNEHEQENFTQLKTNQANDHSNTPYICGHKDHHSFWPGIYGRAFSNTEISFSIVTWILLSLFPQTLASRLYINGRKQRNSPGQTDKQKDSWRKLSQNYLLQNST